MPVNRAKLASFPLYLIGLIPSRLHFIFTPPEILNFFDNCSTNASENRDSQRLKK